ncbi:hypothetical protein [Streptomyces sp. WAC 06783]|uniref:hypothetical protein n=1 Tax=Streptomyces sp. WAC 06783 TaxID=2203211 RepID=UPI0021ADF442|nr:hypothetical protein [Streptomyces sp. WAC 06783]
MPETSAEVHYACAALRHHDDAVLLLEAGRLPNADYHFGFAVECALKCLLLKHTEATMNPVKEGAAPQKKPWVREENQKPKFFGHLPGLWTDVALLLHGRSGSKLVGVLNASAPFDTWSVDHRYLDGTDAVEADIHNRRAATESILSLFEQALIAGDLT